jgi:cytochrome P450
VPATVPPPPSSRAPAPPARLAQAVFESLPREDDTTLANTLAGVMMGYLPTLDGQLRAVLNEWLRLGEFWSLRAAWAADPESQPTAAKAERVLGPALRRTMQFRPVPELIWRTATRDGTQLGNVTLQAGDIVVLSLTSANQQRLADGLSQDVYAVFGGERKAGGPTHACPGYVPAMQVLLGVLAGWMDCQETLRPTPAPLAFTLEGRT